MVLRRTTRAVEGSMHWNKDLAYFITPKSGPMRGMETLIDANHALSQDLPNGYLKRPHWVDAAYLVVQAAETGREHDVQVATDELLRAIEQEGWMNRARLARG
jgi:hypothetical protein